MLSSFVILVRGQLGNKLLIGTSGGVLSAKPASISGQDFVGDEGTVTVAEAASPGVIDNDRSLNRSCDTSSESVRHRRSSTFRTADNMARPQAPRSVGFVAKRSLYSTIRIERGSPLDHVDCLRGEAVTRCQDVACQRERAIHHRARYRNRWTSEETREMCRAGDTRTSLRQRQIHRCLLANAGAGPWARDGGALRDEVSTSPPAVKG